MGLAMLSSEGEGVPSVLSFLIA